MGILSLLGGAGVARIAGQALGGIPTLIKAFFGSKYDRERWGHEEQMAVQGAFAAEFAPRENRTWWDSFVDGLNRLPRPIMTFGTIALFAWAVMDPAEFIGSMVALSAVPGMLWTIFLTIIGFWFGGRIIDKGFRRPPTFKMASADQIREIINLRKEVNYMSQEQGDAQTDPIDDVPPPKSNSSIDAWRKKGTRTKLKR